MPRIIAAAFMVDGIIMFAMPPARHHTIVNTISPKGIRDIDRYESGFLLDDGSFCSRENAAILAHENGQLTKKLISPGRLFSEDLW